jgi:hypothetical protein
MVPKGLTARQDTSGVVFEDDKGTVKLAYVGGPAFDTAKTVEDRSYTTVDVRLVDDLGNGTVVVESARFPVTLDPVWSFPSAIADAAVFIQNDPYGQPQYYYNVNMGSDAGNTRTKNTSWGNGNFTTSEFYFKFGSISPPPGYSSVEAAAIVMSRTHPDASVGAVDGRVKASIVTADWQENQITWQNKAPSSDLGDGEFYWSEHGEGIVDMAW